MIGKPENEISRLPKIKNKKLMPGKLQNNCCFIILHSSNGKDPFYGKALEYLLTKDLLLMGVIFRYAI